MYIPGQFKQQDMQRNITLMKENAFASLITMEQSLPYISHIPMLIEQRDEALVLRGHLAYANDQWRHLQQGQTATALFQGPHCYISPNWYQSAGLPPTWNYAVIHARGTAEILDNTALKVLVEALAEQYEQNLNPVWKPDYNPKMLSAIVGFEIRVSDIEAKFKLSQNRSIEDQQSAVKRLAKSEHENQRNIARLMQTELNSRSE